MLIVGCDIGGTFTDIVLQGTDPEVMATRKVLSTPDDPGQAVLDGIRDILREHDSSAQDLSLVAHATTIATNALIERKGARTALITTRGFRDILALGHEARYDIYDLRLRFPEPLVPRDLRLEVRERTEYTGNVLAAVDLRELDGLATHLAADGIEAVAISFLHSYQNDQNEREAVEALSLKLPDISISSSADVQPEIREYERTSTAVVNAYLQPVMSGYVAKLHRELTRSGFDGRFLIMASGGGVVTPELAARYPARCLESGPAAGAMFAGVLSERLGLDSVVSFDMGGTTAKVALIVDGVPDVAPELEAARVHRFKRGSGIPVRGATVDLIEIGAGGGSIASVDSLGLIQVGPRSAGAKPGPASYALGGADPCVTDADLIIGYLDPESFLEGRMRLDRAAAARAFGPLAQSQGMSVAEAAAGVNEIVNENMANAARIHIVEKGFDPASLTMIAFGGAGPVHAAAVAERLGIDRIVFPVSASVASALGLVVAPLRVDLVHSHLVPLTDESCEASERLFGQLGDDAAQMLEMSEIEVTRSADIRFSGQGYEVTTPLPNTRLTPETVDSAFRSAYRARYGDNLPDLPVEFVTVRLAARADLASLPLQSPSTLATDAPASRRPVYEPDRRESHEWDVLKLGALAAGPRPGPCIIELGDTTLVIPRGWNVALRDDVAVVAERAKSGA